MLSPLRTREELTDRLHFVWSQYFSDLPDIDSVIIRFGSKAKTRLGSIRRRFDRTVITVTGYFRDPSIPNVVLDETIAHELCHYAHGFESPLPQLYRYPHQGGIITSELQKRGLLILHRQARQWLKMNWQHYRTI